MPVFFVVLIVGVAWLLIGVIVSEAKTSGLGATPAKVREFANAIAFAEGYHDRAGNVLTGNVPAQFNNPGDLGPGDAPGLPSEFKGGSRVVKFPTIEEGWAALFRKIERAFRGDSQVYNVEMTIQQWGNRYAADSRNWAKNVAFYLGVTVDTKVADWLRR